ncbi:MAG: NAD-dependent epimerase/dehydratase family protein, partial [Bacteriovorax sp.]|nr:NAD-dependent epimerase/dehydratase family protein [Rhizobacter sp.]
LVYINGDGDTSRDFCFVANAVQANLLAATAPAEAANQVYNVAVGDQTTLNELYALLAARLAVHQPALAPPPPPVNREFRAGDVRHSLADISKARRLLWYAPTHRIGDGLDAAARWYVNGA